MDRILTLEQVAAEGDATRRRTAALFVAGIVIGALVLGAFVWMAGPGLAPNSPPGEATVAMKNIAFNPGVLNVARGTTVTWVNQDPVYHTVTSDAPGGPLDSPSINQGERWTFTFTQDGTYAYHCTPHSSYDAGTQMWTGMTGKVVVGTGQGGNGTGPLDLPHATYDARTTRPAAGEKWIVLEAKELPLEVAPGKALAAWTFGGSLPGPILRVVEGDLVHFTLYNNGTMAHSMDFHAAETPWNVNYQPVQPGTSYSFDWTAMWPGVFMYHCGAAPVLAHLSNGMYGVIIVDPAVDTRPVPDVEYALVQSEIYLTDAYDANGVYHGDITKMETVDPTYVVFNGYANQYKDAPLTAGAGQRIRLHVLNAGPTTFSAFHVIGAMFDRVWVDGNPANEMVGLQTWQIAPGGGATLDLVIPAAGLYPFVTHSFAYTGLGALGLIQVA